MRRVRLASRLALGAALALPTFAGAAACGGAVKGPRDRVDFATLRSKGASSGDAELVGRWLLEESFAPGGDVAQAKKARGRLDGTKTKGDGLYAGLARGFWDETHGKLALAADGYAAAVAAAPGLDPEADPDGPLAAWIAAAHLTSLKSSVPGLWDRHGKTVEQVLAAPGGAGWRTTATLLDWSITERERRAPSLDEAYDREVTARLGCATKVAVAGPFGRGLASDRRRAFPAETAPWRGEWPKDPARAAAPRTLATERYRCLTAGSERADDGLYYAQTFFDAAAPRELVVAAQSALRVWVDDVLVVDRDLREWGVWQRFGAHVRVPAGRHRVLVKLATDATAIRLLEPDGRPARIETDTDDARPYGLGRPEVLADPNAIEPVVKALRAGIAPATPLAAALAAHVAMIEGSSDVAAALVDPWVTPKDAAPLALEVAARFARGDVALPEQERRLAERELHARAVAKDEGLWYARTWLALDEAEQRGDVEAAPVLRKLGEDFPDVPEVSEQLARLYGKLGWRAERLETLAAVTKRFPEDASAVSAYLAALDEDGRVTDADAVAARVKKLDPDSEVDLDRALARRDFDAAVRELERLGKRRPDRKDIAVRIADVRAQSGDTSKALEELAKALAKSPRDSETRLRLADAALARGDERALSVAMAEAVRAGAKGAEIRAALDRVEGSSRMAPYRIDGRRVVREFEAWQKRGKKMDGTAARVLDYSVVWARKDGSHDMLEHELVRVQSQEAVRAESEQRVPEGTILSLRVIKPDGSVLEPDRVAGKPTLTMPHLEVGDYVEIEHVTSSNGDGTGRTFRGPHWFFREPDKGYWRSEIVVLTPKEKDAALQVETVGDVGAPKVKDHGVYVERRWRVDESPPAPEEPDAPPAREFLPSVRLGWGVSLDETLERLVDAVAEETPLDPRLKKRALALAGGESAGREARARAAYRFVTQEVQDGPESDGRRVITGRSGARQPAFLYLLRLLDVPYEIGLAKDRLAPPPRGPMSELEAWDNVVVRVQGDKAPVWATVRDKFAPFAYLPAEVRGQEVIRLVPGAPREKTPAAGALDGVFFEARADLRADGSATVDFVQRWGGRMAIGMRGVLDRIPEAQRKDFVEARVLSRNFPGARLVRMSVEDEGDPGAPLGLAMRAEVPDLVRFEGTRAVLKSVFPVHLAQVATLPARTTPLFLPSASHVEVKLKVVVPETFRLPASLPTGEARDGDRFVVVRDAVHGRAIELDRVVDVPAGRVAPGADYARFLEFVRASDTLLEREIALGR